MSSDDREKTVDVPYFVKELNNLKSTLGNRSKNNVGRYLRRLADITDAPMSSEAQELKPCPFCKDKMILKYPHFYNRTITNRSRVEHTLSEIVCPISNFSLSAKLWQDMHPSPDSGLVEAAKQYLRTSNEYMKTVENAGYIERGKIYREIMLHGSELYSALASHTKREGT